MKKIIVCITVLALALSLSSCAFLPGTSKDTTETFQIKDMSITLEGDFKYYDPIEQIGNYDGVLESSKAKIIVIDKAVEGFMLNGISSYDTSDGKLDGIYYSITSDEKLNDYEAETKYYYYDDNSAILEMVEVKEDVVISGDLDSYVSEQIKVIDSVDDLIGSMGIPEDAVYDEATGLLYYEHELTVVITEVSCVCYVYLNGTTVWMVEMMCKAENYAEMRPMFENWAKSVTFAG